MHCVGSLTREASPSSLLLLLLFLLLFPLSVGGTVSFRLDDWIHSQGAAQTVSRLTGYPPFDCCVFCWDLALAPSSAALRGVGQGFALQFSDPDG